MPRFSSQYDPLTTMLAPPSRETQQQRKAREEAEARASEISSQIDAELKAAKQAMKRNRPIRVLVLGHSMSGKTTTIKNFQMAYAQKSWAEERASWHVVVLFNLVRNVNTIVSILNQEIADSSSVGRGSDLTEWHRSIIFRLTPLRRLEKDLKMFLGSKSFEIGEEPDSHRRPSTAPPGECLDSEGRNEFCVWSSSGWKDILAQVRSRSQGKGSQLLRVVRRVLSSCKDDMLSLWKDPIAKQFLRTSQGPIEESPGFFLNDLDRILLPDYIPTDDDIVRARLRTTGVQEYRFILDKGNTVRDWIMYDIAGIRTSKAAWIPYFPDITSLIFLAPLSSFNETVPEHLHINCLDDTFALWKTICSSKLLTNVQLILFMNKIDILQRKLDQGIQVRDYVHEFGDNSNDFATVSEWFRRVFKKLFTENNKTPQRTFIAYFTSVIDTRATGRTLHTVQEAILRNDMVEAGLM